MELVGFRLFIVRKALSLLGSGLSPILVIPVSLPESPPQIKRVSSPSLIPPKISVFIPSPTHNILGSFF